MKPYLGAFPAGSKACCAANPFAASWQAPIPPLVPIGAARVIHSWERPSDLWRTSAAGEGDMNAPEPMDLCSQDEALERAQQRLARTSRSAWRQFAGRTSRASD